MANEDLAEAMGFVMPRLEEARATQEPSVALPVDILLKVWSGVKSLSETQSKQASHIKELLDTQSEQEKRSVTSFYVGLILGGFIGVLGNFFVSFWFVELTAHNILGLAFSGLAFILICAALLLRARKYASKMPHAAQRVGQ